MFHNVLMTTLTPMRDTNEVHGWDNRPLCTIWPETKQEKIKDNSVKKTIKKKKRNRTMFTTEQIRVLERLFAQSKYIDVERRKEISECLQIEQKCIKIWFQNRRMKEKKELSESCDSTSECQISLKSLSPPLKSSQHSFNECNTNNTNPCVRSDVRCSQNYYDAPNNYPKANLHHNEPNSYNTLNTGPIPEYVNYNNNNCNSNVWRDNTDYISSYYPSQSEFPYFYHAGEQNNQYISTNVRDWPANVFDTSYF